MCLISGFAPQYASEEGVGKAVITLSLGSLRDGRAAAGHRPAPSLPAAAPAAGARRDAEAELMRLHHDLRNIRKK